MIVYTEAEGIKAIIALMKLTGCKETEAKAKRGWRGMTNEEKEKTMLAYKTCFPEDVPQVGPGT